MYERCRSLCSWSNSDLSAWPKNAVPGQVDETVLFNFGFTAITASIILWSISLFTISLVTTTKESHQEKLSELNYIETEMIQTEIENNLTNGMDLLHLEVENESES